MSIDGHIPVAYEIFDCADVVVVAVGDQHLVQRPHVLVVLWAAGVVLDLRVHEQFLPAWCDQVEGGMAKVREFCSIGQR